MEFERLRQELGEGWKIVGHVEKVEEAEAKEPAAQAQEIEIVQAEEDITAEAETVETTGQRRRKTQSIAAIKAAAAAKDNPQKKSGKKETKWRRATEEGLGDVDLEEAMEDTETDRTMQ